MRILYKFPEHVCQIIVICLSVFVKDLEKLEISFVSYKPETTVPISKVTTEFAFKLMPKLTDTFIVFGPNFEFCPGLFILTLAIHSKRHEFIIWHLYSQIS